MRSADSIPGDSNLGAELETMPSFLLNHIVHKYHQILQSRLRSTGVSTLQMRIILTLQSYERLTVGELCNYAIAEQPTMSRALDSLESHGLVRREMSEIDSRLRVISLTEEGQRLSETLRPVFKGINESMMAGLPEEQRVGLTQQLGTMLTTLSKL